MYVEVLIPQLLNPLGIWAEGEISKTKINLPWKSSFSREQSHRVTAVYHCMGVQSAARIRNHINNCRLKCSGRVWRRHCLLCVSSPLQDTFLFFTTYRQQIPSSMDLRQEQVAYPTSQLLARSIFSVAADGEIPK